MLGNASKLPGRNASICGKCKFLTIGMTVFSLRSKKHANLCFILRSRELFSFCDYDYAAMFLKFVVKLILFKL